ncbi:unnamed protein product [Effrenium voratum]|uniref:Uncharacterized protein n=1 Tax=Effrenium voratum TaxID=2562239 RepID=A0AA36ML50_9DINO|nr:unnamed protein product [Effrenium voratum]
MGMKKGAGSPKKNASVQFFLDDEASNVTANRVDLKTSSEYWTQSTNMSSLDTRGELIRQRDAKDSWSNLSSSARKQSDLKSQVLGGTPKSSQSPSASVGSLSPRAHSPRNYAVHETRLPLSARDLKANDLATSESQLTGFASPSAALSPRGAVKAFRDRSNEDLRRGNCQFTDLTGRTETSPRTPKRSEMHHTAGSYWATATTEISRKNYERKSGECKENTGTLIHHHGAEVDAECLSPRSNPESPQAKKHREEERACYDAASQHSTGLELSRRRREMRASKSMGALPEPDNLSAAERKRAHLASGQLRTATGAQPEPHDDGRAAGWASPRSGRTTVSQPPCPKLAARGLMNQPNMYQYRNLAAASPRARKIQEQSSSLGFF